MPDEHAEPDQDHAPFEPEGTEPDSARHGRAPRGWRAALSGRSARWWAIQVMLVVLVLIIGGFVYLVDVTTNPGHGPEATRARRVADAAAKHLSSDSRVVSAKVVEASADPGGTIARVDARLEHGTSPEQAAALLASTHDAAFGTTEENQGIISGAHLSWTVNGSSIESYFDLSAASSDIKAHTVKDLAPAREAATLLRPEEPPDLRVDYGSVTTMPSPFTSPSGSRATKSLSMRGWMVETYSDDDRQFSAAPFDKIVTAVQPIKATGTIKASSTTLSVTGLAGDHDQSLTVEAAALVLHAIADCRAAGLSELKLNPQTTQHVSSDDEHWLTFTCNNDTWTPQHGGSASQDEATILQKATEL